MFDKDEVRYFSKPRKLREYLKDLPNLPLFHTEKVGNMKAYCFSKIPIFVEQYNPNFKKKYFIGSAPLLSIKRCPKQTSTLQKDRTGRKSRIYLSLGSLPFFDNHSGIPRVAKELCKAGITRTDVSVVPVYPDPLTGTYRVAVAWLRSRNLKPRFEEWGTLEKEEDPEITVQKGDWLLHTMVNSNELVFMEAQLKAFQSLGGKVGFVLHDLIPEDYPQFYKSRDVKLFRHWLLEITKYDALFPISNATKQAYLQWIERNHIQRYPRVEHFHLGADFEGKSTRFAKLPPTVKVNSPFFLQVGTLEPRKGHDQILEAFEELWHEGFEGSCVFVGREGWKVKKLMSKIRKHSELGQRLFWFNKVKDDELTALYQHATAVVVASYVEGFGLSVAEALYNNKALIVRDIPVFKEIAREKATYFQDTETLKDAIRKTNKCNQNTELNIKITSWKESFEQLKGIIKNEH